MKTRKRIIAISISFSLSFGVFSHTASAETLAFNDVPANHWSYEDVNALRELGVTTGIGDNHFGFGKTITRAEFVTFLCNLMKWENSAPSAPAFADNSDTTAWYYYAVETALHNGVLSAADTNFRPDQPITREEMAVMLINSLGYEELANRLDYLGSPFPDVLSNKGHITMAKDLGIISGVTDSSFAPDDTATREQAAAMMVRMYRLLQNKADMVNGFYAIKSSSQIDAVSKLDTVSFGWSRLETDGAAISLNTTNQGGNEYNIPAGWETPWQAAKPNF